VNKSFSRTERLTDATIQNASAPSPNRHHCFDPRDARNAGIGVATLPRRRGAGLVTPEIVNRLPDEQNLELITA
jgi:hypothetical protein